MSKKTATTAPATDLRSAGDPVSKFEGSLQELEAIVAKMERGDLPLEQSLSLFERGMQLSKDCRVSLETAELRVRNLLDAERDATPDSDA
jgi:exodeoxyribonuclease VII small subunit